MPNYENGRRDRKIDYALKNLLGGGLIEVPYFCLMVAIVFIVASILSQTLSVRGYFHSGLETLNFGTISRNAAYAAFIILWCIYISIFYRYDDFTNWSAGGQLVREHRRGLPGLLLGSIFLGLLSGSFNKGDDRKKLFIALILAIVSSIIVQAWKPVESEDYRNIFKENNAFRVAYFWGCMLFPFLALNKRHHESDRVIKAGLILLVGLCAGFLLNLIFAGYLKTGYFSKCCPIVMFGLFPILASFVRYSGNSYLSLHPRLPASNWLGLVVVGMFVMEWVASSYMFVQLLPPHGADSIRWIAQNCAGQVIVTQNYAMPYAYETKGSARYCLPNNILSENETPHPVKFDLEKTWIRQSDLIPGFEKPTIIVEYKQNHTLYGWADNLDAFIREEKQADAVSICKREKKLTSSIFKKSEPNNHFEVFRLNWDPIPYITLTTGGPEGFFRAPYPILSESFARPLRSLELKNIGFKKDDINSSVKIKDAGTGLAIIQKGKNPTQLNPKPVLRKNNDNMMLYGVAEYADQLSEEGDSKISLYSVTDTNKKEMNERKQDLNERKQDYYELELLAEASAKVGLNPPLANNEVEYVIGYQPVAKDGRKGLVYLSRPFRLSGVGIIQSSAR